tara:strand:+ start:1857 stop:2090 length:234 start_codon:yes stop_codon:yes gene_type:complete
MRYLKIIKDPVNTDIKIIKLDVLMKYTKREIVIIENTVEIIIGDIKNLNLKLLDHFESIEKNKNKEAKITIGINIAL